jgi:hypothetical protein
MAQRHEVEAWVNPSAWDDEDEARRVVDAIMASGTDDEAEWVRLAQGSEADALTAATRDWQRATEQTDRAWEALADAARTAVAAGMSESEATRVTGVSRPTIRKWLGK